MQGRKYLIKLARIILIVISCAEFGHALQLKLLWNKTISGRLRRHEFARISGDTIMNHNNGITILNKHGQTIWQWGPNFERGVADVSISEDGRYFAFSTDIPDETDASIKPYVHFYERGKGELWIKEIVGDPLISPDGCYIFVGTGWEGASGYMLDSRGSILWKKDGLGGNARYSPDSKFIWNGFNLKNMSGDTILDPHNYDIGGWLTSVSKDAKYLAFEGRGSSLVIQDKDGRLIATGANGGIYDKQGNLILGGTAQVSEDGSIGVIYMSDKLEIYGLPEKSLIGSHPIKRKYFYTSSDLSASGDRIVLFGERVDRKTFHNLFVIDVNTDRLYEFEVEPGYGIHMTNDGRYFMFWKDNTLFCYEII